MKFYLGTHQLDWMWKTTIPLFISHRRLRVKKKLKPSTTTWALDSGGFSELSLFGKWTISPHNYASGIKKYQEYIGRLEWAACQDWMCEEFILAKTGKTVTQHQSLTIDSFLELKNIDSSLPVIPILQGFKKDEYFEHIQMYLDRGINLMDFPLVGIGSVCRRQSTTEATGIIKEISNLGIKLHGFGYKLKGLVESYKDLKSSDSMAWSFNARKNPPLPGCSHLHCSSCLTWATQWYEKVLKIIKCNEEYTIYC